MKALLLPGSTLLLLGLGLLGGSAGPVGTGSRSAEVLLAHEPALEEDSTGAERARRARLFLGSLEQPLLERAHMPLDHPERKEWTNLPSRNSHGGVRFEELTSNQLEAALDLVASLLSEQGYEQTRGILLADETLLPEGMPREGFGVDAYHIMVFGEPTPDGPWAVQLDGHHLAWNAAMLGDGVSLSPSFIGTQPARFEWQGEQLEPMALETDAAFALVGSLDDAQLAAARIGERRGQLEAGPGRDDHLPETAGLSLADISEEQRTLVLELVHAYVGDLPAADARRRMARIEKSLDGLHLAWWGPHEPGSDISYRLQGPDLLIEYACQNLGGVPQQHLHSILRTPGDAYGSGLGE